MKHDRNKEIHPRNIYIYGRFNVVMRNIHHKLRGFFSYFIIMNGQ
jgi:hypothetical protein